MPNIYLTGEQVCAVLHSLEASTSTYSGQSARHKRELQAVKAKIEKLLEREASHG